MYANMLRKNRKVIIIGKGGLGNQLFQLNLVYFLKSNFGYDAFFLPNEAYKNSGLQIFLKSSSNQLNNQKVWQVVLLKMSSKIGRLYEWFMKNFSVSESELEIESIFSKGVLPRSHFNFVVLDGFWQSIQNSHNVSDVLLSNLKLFLAREINTPEKVKDVSNLLVVHIRRGDYVDQGHQNIYGLVELDTYIATIEKVRSSNSAVRVITVTDSPEMIAAEKNVSALGIILGPGDCDMWQVLKLMSLAETVICANSTLSWWGGVLARENNAEVFIPVPWYRNQAQMADLGSFIRNSKSYPSGI